MSTAPTANQRPNTALLVIDVQNEVVRRAYARDDVVATINDMVVKARDASVPVIWIQHDDEDLPADTDGWQIVPELDPQPGEPIVRKNYRDSFTATDLDAVLRDRDVGRLIVAGSQTDFCVRWTLHGALNRGYDTVLVADAHTTDAKSPGGRLGVDIVRHTNWVWASLTSPLGSHTVKPAAEISFPLAT